MNEFEKFEIEYPGRRTGIACKNKNGALLIRGFGEPISPDQLRDVYLAMLRHYATTDGWLDFTKVSLEVRRDFLHAQEQMYKNLAESIED